MGSKKGATVAPFSFTRFIIARLRSAIRYARSRLPTLMVAVASLLLAGSARAAALGSQAPEASGLESL